MTDEEIRESAAKMLDNMAAIEMEDVSPEHADCFYCRQSASNAAQLRYAAAALRDPAKFLLLHRRT